MSTPLTDRINALTALANGKTGAEDTTLTDAVKRLIDGYGSSTGTDVIIGEEQIVSPSFAEYLYDLIGGETGKIYVALWKGNTELTNQRLIAMLFANYTTACIGGMIRWNAGGIYQGLPVSNTYNARAYPGDVYTVYCIDSDSGELYPVGTDVVSEYIGRDWSNGSVPMVRGNVDHETGEYEENESGSFSISLNYIPVSPGYQFAKSGSAGFLYRVLFYDGDKNFLSGMRFTPNWNIWFTFTIPAEARYMRIATHSADSYKNVYLFRKA